MDPLVVETAPPAGIANPGVTPRASMPPIDRVAITPARIEYSPTALALARLLCRAPHAGAIRFLARLVVVALVASLLAASFYL